jgi:hypothetical protein
MIFGTLRRLPARMFIVSAIIIISVFIVPIVGTTLDRAYTQSGANAIGSTGANAIGSTGANAIGSTQIGPVVYPMVVNITGLSTTLVGGRLFLMVTMVATNNIGIVPSWRNEKVQLLSVNFTMNYNSTSVAESVNGVLVQPAIPTPMTFSANESKTFSVTVGPLPSGIGGTLVVQVNGWYSWFFAAQGAEENPPIGITHGGGRFDSFTGTVAIG